MHDLSYNEKNLNSFGFAITTKPFYKIATRDIDIVSVLGRSGSVIVDNDTYNNVDVSYEVNSLPYRNNFDVHSTVRAFTDWLSTFDGEYKILRDTYNSGYFTKAICTNISDITNDLCRYLKTTITFSRLPFWFSDLGQQKVSSTSQTFKIFNPEPYTSQPYIKIFGNWPLTLVINDDKYDILSGSTRSYIEIDSESYDVYAADLDCNKYFDSDYMPKLQSGDNTITIDTTAGGSFTKIEIIPRWRRL